MYNKPLVYGPDQKNGLEFKLSRLSPVSKFFLDTSLAAFGNEKNVVLLDPYYNYHGSLLLAFDYAREYKKSVYINLAENILDIMNKDYYLINSHIPAYRIAPIGFIDEDGKFKIEPYIPTKVSKRNHRYFKEDIIEYAKLSEKARIILGSTTHSDETLDIEASFCSHDIGLIITELHSLIDEKYVDNVIKWAKSKDSLFVFKVNTLNIELIQRLASGLNAIVVPAIPNIFLLDEHLTTESKKYFVNNLFPERSSFFNIDTLRIYEGKSNNIIKVVHNTPGPLNYFRRRLYALRKDKTTIKDIDTQSIVDALITLSYRYMDSFVTPPLLHLPISISGKYTTKRGTELVKNLSDKLRHLNHHEYVFCDNVIDTHNSIYRIINESKRYGTNNPYSSENKLYVLLNLIEKEIENNETILIVTTNRRERIELKKIINRYFSKLVDEKRITIQSQSDAYWSQSNPGLVIFSNFLDKQYEGLSTRYENSIVLGYDNCDADFAEAQIQYNTKVTEELISFYNDSIYEIKDSLGIEGIMSPIESLDVCSEDVNKDKSAEHVIVENEISESIEDDMTDMDKIFAELFNSSKRTISRKDLYDEDKIRSEIITKGTSYVPSSENDTGIIVKLTNIFTGEITDLSLSRTKSYIFLDPNITEDDNMFESRIDKEKIGMNIIILEGNGRSALIDLAKEVYGRDDLVDEQIIDIWKTEVEDISLVHGDKKRLYKAYKKIGGKVEYSTFIGWLSLKVIAPRDPVDLKLLGEVVNSENIISYHELISDEAQEIRKLNRTLGRHLNKIIAAIFNKSTLSLDPESENIRIMLENRIYQIEEVFTAD